MKKKILVVDNHPMILKLMSNLLEKEGYEVKVASDGLSALDILKNYMPELIFVDLIMPNISGDKLCRIIRSMPEFKDVYLVILSAIAAEEEVDFLAFGADACIGKGPFKNIAQHVHTLIENREQGKQHTFGNKIIGGGDVYEREVTKELLSSKRHFEIILNNMSEGILELTPEGRIIYVNPIAAALIRLPEEKILGGIFADYFHAENKKQIKKMVAGIDKRPFFTDDDLPFDLNERLVSLSILPVQDDEGKSLIVIVSDITERKKAEDELKKAQTLMVRQEKLASIGTLASGVAHEMLNPLNIIGAIAQVMQLEENLPEPLKGNIDDILLQIRRATKITNNLRMFSHSHEQAKEIQPVNMNDLFDQTLILLDHDMQFENIVIERDFDKNLPQIEADEDQLAQVVVNLLNNARGAMHGKKKKITIKTRSLDNGIKISIIDNGVGIPKKYIDKIFDPFFTTKDPGQGTGLGLSIVYSIIENHGGSIQVQSEEGKGTCLTIQLPKKSKPKKFLDPEALFR